MTEIARKITLNNAVKLPTLSAAIIVKNEGKYLKNVLNAIKGVIEEIIVVDTGSTDNTKQIAESFGAKVYDFPWCDDFSAARNESLKHCTQEYIIWLDADDFIQKQDVIKLKWEIKSNPNSAYFLTIIDKRQDMEFQSIQLRVFPNNKNLKFIGRVHEQIAFSVEDEKIPYKTLSIRIFHYGYASEELITSKLSRNLELLLKDKIENDTYLVNLGIAKTLTGLQRIEDSNIYIDNCLEMIDNNTTNVATENQVIAVLTKLNYLQLKGKNQEAFDLLHKYKDKFKHLDSFVLSYGEAAFKIDNYKIAHENFLKIKNNGFSVGIIPLNVDSMFKNLSLLLLFASLHEGDKDTAEDLIRSLCGKNDFTISERLMINE